MGWLLPHLPIRPGLAGAAVAGLSLASACGCLGLFSRTSALASAIFGFYVFGLTHFYGKVDHNDQHLVWFALLLAASPCGDALSIDALLRGRRAGPATDRRRAAAEYTVPLRVTAVLIGAVYFFPGLWKIRESGAGYVAADNVRDQLRLFWTWSYAERWLPTFRIDRHPALCRAAGLAAIVFELSFVFLVFSRRLRPLAAVAGVAFHAATGALLQIHFFTLQACYAALIDWPRIGRALRRAAPPPDPATDAVPARPAASGLHGCPALVLLVGAFLAAAEVAASLGRHVSGWPFACYPVFSVPAPREIPALGIAAVDARGREASVTDLGLAPHRLYGLCRNILAIDDPADRDDRLRLLWAQALRMNPALASAAEARFTRETRAIDPELWPRNPRGSRIVLRVVPAAADGAPRPARPILPDAEWQ